MVGLDIVGWEHVPLTAYLSANVVFSSWLVNEMFGMVFPQIRECKHIVGHSCDYAFWGQVHRMWLKIQKEQMLFLVQSFSPIFGFCSHLEYSWTQSPKTSHFNLFSSQVQPWTDKQIDRWLSKLSRYLDSMDGKIDRLRDYYLDSCLSR